MLEKKGGIATLTLNRPEKYNALNRTMSDELTKAMSDITGDRDVRVLVITGAGSAFCAGADVESLREEMTPIQVWTWTRETGNIILSMADLEKPVIAKVNGVAAGVGCSLALNADIIIASEIAKFNLVFSRAGLICDGGSSFNVARLVGPAKAKELYFTARSVEAQEAERIGLINRAIPAGQLDEEVNKLAEQLANGPIVAFGIAKKIINKGLNMDLSAVLELEAAVQTVIETTEDFKEGVNAFLQKRNPKFRGK